VGLAPEEIVDGRYRVVRRIGSGGMADVWLAADTELDRQVALKVLHENFARDREFVERFRREASSAAGLQHPNVVGVFDRGRYGDTYYIAMEFVDGSSLRDLVAHGMEPHEAVEVTRQVLDGAEFAHERGIVHRDLKPANVLIDRSGRTRVTDFGIARAGESEITQTGSVMGTAQYLSPEQAQGMEVTAAADIYSIGVMLFEMLTGRVPFEGDNTVAIAMKQVSEQPVAPSTINPAVSPSLDAVVLRALAKDPANRFASAAEMRAALDAA
jgi:eukaryotic-like serine/threonine-protein kinase